MLGLGGVAHAVKIACGCAHYYVGLVGAAHAECGVGARRARVFAERKAAGHEGVAHAVDAALSAVEHAREHHPVAARRRSRGSLRARECGGEVHRSGARGGYAVDHHIAAARHIALLRVVRAVDGVGGVGAGFRQVEPAAVGAHVVRGIGDVYVQVGQHLVAAVGAAVGAHRGHEGGVHQLLGLAVASLLQQALNLGQTFGGLGVIVVGAAAAPHAYLVEHHVLAEGIAVGHHTHASVAHRHRLLPLFGRRRVPKCLFRVHVCGACRHCARDGQSPDNVLVHGENYFISRPFLSIKNQRPLRKTSALPF